MHGHPSGKPDACGANAKKPQENRRMPATGQSPVSLCPLRRCLRSAYICS